MANAPADPSAGVDLAQEPDFQLGALLVCPSASRVRGRQGDQKVEPRVMQVLVVLVRHAGRTVTRDQLIDACWGGRIVSDDAVTRVVAQVRHLTGGLDPAPFILETVPKVGFRLIAPDHQPTAGDDDAVRPAPSQARPRASAWRRRAAMVAVPAAILLAAAGGWTLWRTAEPDSSTSRSGQNGRVEVVRFSARQPDPTLERLSAELGDSLVRLLTLAGVNTAPGVAERGDGTSAGDAELRIAGSVDREGATYVINAQILDRKTGQVLWSQRSEQPAGTTAASSDATAVAIAATLQCALWERKRSGRPLKPTSLALMMNACDTAASGTRMLEATRRLVQAEPDLAAAHAMYAEAQASAAEELDFASDETAALRRGARASAGEALKLDPRSDEAHLAIALSYPDGGNWAEREAQLLQARAIDPNFPPTLMIHVTLLRDVGRLGAALEASKRVLASGAPGTAYMAADAILLSAQTGDLAGAHELLTRAEIQAPDSVRGARWTIAMWWEDLGAARAVVRDAGKEPGAQQVAPCLDKYLDAVTASRTGRVLGLPPECAALAPDWRVRLLSREGDVDGAYAEFSKPRPNSRSSLYFLFYPEMKAFRRDPRFMPLAKRLGLVDYWRTSNRWPDFCAEPDLPYDCRAVARGL